MPNTKPEVNAGRVGIVVGILVSRTITKGNELALDKGRRSTGGGRGGRGRSGWRVGLLIGGGGGSNGSEGTLRWYRRVRKRRITWWLVQCIGYQCSSSESKG